MYGITVEGKDNPFFQSSFFSLSFLLNGVTSGTREQWPHLHASTTKYHRALQGSSSLLHQPWLSPLTTHLSYTNIPICPQHTSHPPDGSCRRAPHPHSLHLPPPWSPLPLATSTSDTYILSQSSFSHSFYFHISLLAPSIFYIFSLKQKTIIRD